MIDPLLQRARQGDRAALEEVLARHAPAIYRFSLRMCRNPADAEDTLQDTLLAISSHLGDFAGRASLLSWIFALTRSACVRRRRGRKNQPATPLAEAAEPRDGTPGPEEQASRRELADVLTEALDHIPDTYREVILLRDVEGLSAIEAAEALGVTVVALKSRLHRARQVLREALSPILEADGGPGPGCPDVVQAWSEKLEGDLSSADCAAMEDHLRGCPSCSATCEALRRSLAACKRAGAADVPPEIQAQVKAALRRFTLAAPVQQP